MNILINFVIVSQQELMKDAYARSIDREGQNGLIIIKGIYGKIDNSTTINETSEKIIHVTVPLQVLIKDHSLQILTDSTKVDKLRLFLGSNSYLIKRYVSFLE